MAIEPTTIDDATISKPPRKLRGYVLHGLKVISFAVIGLCFVITSALLVSIIQFQIRVIEAKNQSKNFSLTSLTQSVAMQREFVNSVKRVQEEETTIADYQDFQIGYLAELSQFTSVICQSVRDVVEQQKCNLGLPGALQSGAATPLYVKSVITYFAKGAFETAPDDFSAVTKGVSALVERRNQFTSKNGPKITLVRLACTNIERYASTPNELGANTRSPTSTAFVGFINSFPPEYILSARLRCISSFTVGAPIADASAGKGTIGPIKVTGVETGTASRNGSPPTSSERSSQQLQGPVSAKAEKPNFEADLAGALFFDLVSYYQFYQYILGDFLTELAVIAPIDISFVLLVISCGALGAMLRIVGESYNPKLFGKEFSDVEKSSWVYYFIIGVMCSLIVYILAKTVFAGLADITYTAKSGNISPFVIAFMAVVSGLLCEEAFQQIIKAGKATLARSTGNQATTQNKTSGR